LSTLVPLLALAVFPLVAVGFPNPVALYWEFKKGSAPMPPDVTDKAERAAPYMLFPMHALVVILVLFMMLRHSVTAAQVGIHLENWETQLLVGCVAGVSWVGFQRLLLLFVPDIRQNWTTHYLQRGSAVFWVSVYIPGAFAEEFWRAFCLFALTNTGHSVSWSVVLTAIACAAGHARLRFGALMAGIFGIGAALLYLWLGSLLATASGHLVANLGGLYWIRRARPE